MARLRDLNPRHDGKTLIFLCPACRKHEIAVDTTSGPARAPFHGLTGSPPDWDSINIEPSISTENAIGRGRQCGWHGFIRDGEVA